MSWKLVFLAQAMITALSSGGNGLYFWRYRSPLPARRVGAAVMALVSLATLVESLYLGLFVLPHGGPWLESSQNASLLLAARSLVSFGSLGISGLILLRWRKRR